MKTTLRTCELTKQLSEDQAAKLLVQARALQYTPATQGRSNTRLLQWWMGRQVNGVNVGPEIPYWLIKLRDEIYPESDSILSYFFQPQMELCKKQDPDYFSDRSVQLTLLDTLPNLMGDHPFVDFRWGGNQYQQQHGQVWTFHNKVHHAIKPVPCICYVIQFRVVQDATVHQFPEK